jgi:excinuclease UvrABC ATPase subunit
MAVQVLFQCGEAGPPPFKPLRYSDTGNTVIVIEHNLAVVKNADWIIDLGPEGGSKGGEVIFAGTPQQLLEAEQSLTSQYLQRSLER